MAETFSPASAAPLLVVRWSCWTEFIPPFSWLLDAWLVRIHWQECESRDSAPLRDWIAELNKGCIKSFLSGHSRRDIRQIGHVECCCSHMSMQVTWKECPQYGRIRNMSSSWYSSRQAVHLQHTRESQLCSREIRRLSMDPKLIKAHKHLWLPKKK